MFSLKYNEERIQCLEDLNPVDQLRNVDDDQFDLDRLDCSMVCDFPELDDLQFKDIGGKLSESFEEDIRGESSRSFKGGIEAKLNRNSAEEDIRGKSKLNQNLKEEEEENPRGKLNRSLKEEIVGANWNYSTVGDIKVEFRLEENVNPLFGSTILIKVGENVTRVFGFKFCPKDHELVESYLIRKIFDKPLQLDVIQEIDVYKYDPSELPISEFKLGLPGEAYYFTSKVMKYSNYKSQTKRTTPNGYWKATGKEESVINHNKACLGFKKTMVFYWGKAPSGGRTNWVMHEYRANPSLFPHLQHSEDLKLKFQNYVVCRIRNKESWK